jgi:hypothetical protein
VVQETVSEKGSGRELEGGWRGGAGCKATNPASDEAVLFGMLQVPRGGTECYVYVRVGAGGRGRQEARRARQQHTSQEVEQHAVVCHAITHA